MPPLDACTYAGLDNGAEPLPVRRGEGGGEGGRREGEREGGEGGREGGREEGVVRGGRGEGGREEGGRGEGGWRGQRVGKAKKESDGGK